MWFLRVLFVCFFQLTAYIYIWNHLSASKRQFGTKQCKIISTNPRFLTHVSLSTNFSWVQNLFQNFDLFWYRRGKKSVEKFSWDKKDALLSWSTPNLFPQHSRTSLLLENRVWTVSWIPIPLPMSLGAHIQLWSKHSYS